MIFNLLTVLFLSAGGDVLLFDHHAPEMGTVLEIQIVLKSEEEREAAKSAALKVQKEFERLEDLLSEWKEESAFARLNKSTAGRGVVFAAEAFELLERTLSWSRRSAGAFDPTFASLWGLWRFDSGDETRIPSAKEALQRAKLIDYRQVLLDAKSKTVKLGKTGMKLGLGGIAKGYAVDRSVAILRASGFTNFFIKAGGELFLSGKKGTRPWLVGVQDPRDSSHYFSMLALENSAFTTSGDYERFLIKDGTRFHHIIDPKTGYPARKCRGVSIVAPQAEDADALSTAVFVLGPVEGLKLVEELSGVEAVIVTAQGKVVLSSGLKNKLTVEALSPYEGP